MVLPARAYRNGVARRPFDPSLARGGLFDLQPARPGAETSAQGSPPPLTVTQVSERIRGAVDALGRVRVVGEVSNFANRRHWYFTLKDAECQVDCVMWASRSASAGFVPDDGTEVVVTGTVTHYGPRGRTQLEVSSIERRGEGTLQARYDALRRELEALGWFDPARKRELPAFPRRVAVITSFGADALQDVLRTARMRAPFVDILVVGVPVQGPEAAPAVAQAIAAVDRRADELGIDAAIVTRGGGSIEDLWAFNERVVAEAAYRATVPLVSAIGHESDTTILDFVADHRASTPTQAVMALFPDRAAEAERVDSLAGRAARSARRRIAEARTRLAYLARHPLLRSPRAALEVRRAEVERLSARLRSAAQLRRGTAERQLAALRVRLDALRPAARHAAAAGRVEALASRLHAAARRGAADRRRHAEALDRQLRILGPGETLARGWSLSFDASGRLVRRVADARPGAALVTRLADGEVRSTVDPAAPGNG
jgi:exodeoxyribonuclease VII large subunit